MGPHERVPSINETVESEEENHLGIDMVAL